MTAHLTAHSLTQEIYKALQDIGVNPGRSSVLGMAGAIDRVVRERCLEEATLGVGDGSGQLFVHGDYESIKALQAIVLDRAQLIREFKALEREIDELRGAPPAPPRVPGPPNPPRPPRNREVAEGQLPPDLTECGKCGDATCRGVHLTMRCEICLGEAAEREERLREALRSAISMARWASEHGLMFSGKAANEWAALVEPS